MKKKNYLWALATLLSVGTFVSCSDDDDPNVNPGGDGKTEKYVIAASSDEAVYLLDTDNLDTDNLTIVNAGVEAETATAWVFYSDKYVYRLVYNQGNAGVGSSYYLDGNGTLKERNIKFEITNRFTTYGTYGNYVITAASGATANYDDADTEKVYPKYGVTFTYLNVEDQTLNTKTVVTENMVDDNGEYYTLSGIVDANGKLFTALCPQGYSAYGVWKGHEDIDVAAALYPDTNLISSSGTIASTLHPNRVWVAIYDNVNFENPKILSDDRLSFATSRRQSQFYSTIAADDNGNVYVFSASNAVNYAGPHQSDRPSGVVRIKAGAEEFDQDYFCNIQELAGGRHIYRVSHITSDYFLLRMYSNAGETSANTNPTKKMAIFKAGDKTLTWVNSGLPSEDAITDFGLFTYSEDGLIYVPVVTSDGNQPAIYIFNPTTATATKGITVTSSSITAVGKLTYQD